MGTQAMILASNVIKKGNNTSYCGRRTGCDGMYGASNGLNLLAIGEQRLVVASNGKNSSGYRLAIEKGGGCLGKSIVVGGHSSISRSIYNLNFV